MKLKKFLSVVLSMIMVVSLVSAGGTAVFAEEDLSQYSLADLDVINRIIEVNGLQGEKNAPSTWGKFVTFWTKNGDGKKAPMRIILKEQGLTGMLDVSGMTALIELNCDDNALTGVNVSGLSKLQEIRCKNNQLTNLDLTGLTELTTLQCQSNSLESLDVSGLSKLTDLRCFRNKDITTIEGLNDCTSLQILSCGECNLKQLDVSLLTNVQEVNCSNNSLTKLEGIANHINLREIRCDSNQLEALDVSGCVSLTKLWCGWNSLNEIIGLADCTNLANLDCRINKLQALDISKMSATGAVKCENNRLAEAALPTGTIKIENGLNGQAYISEILLDKNKVSMTQTPDDGYAFGGWYTSPNMTDADKIDFQGEVLADTTLYPKFLKTISTEISLAAPVKNTAPQTSIETEEYTAEVAWSPDIPSGGSFASNTEYTATITITPKPNYTVEGIAENGYTVDGAASVENAENSNQVTVVFPKTARNPSGGSMGVSRYTVSFETNGGSETASQSVARNNVISEPSAPTKEGFEFAGWYTDRELTEKYDFSAKVTKNMTLYAKWTEQEQPDNRMILTIGEKSALVFGEIKTNDVAPKIVNDRTMLPARFVAENLGAKVEWNGEQELVTITGNHLKTGEAVIILIPIGAENATVNGKEVKLDSPAFVENDRTYTPIRFISEELGAEVEWVEAEQKVVITKTEE